MCSFIRVNTCLPTFSTVRIIRCINHFHLSTGKQGKNDTREHFLLRSKNETSVEWWWSCQKYGVHLIPLSRFSRKALLEFKYRHVVGLVGLCNRILHTMVYRLLLFLYRVMQCVYLNAQRGQESLVISLRVLQNSYDCSLSMQSGSPSTFVLLSIFLVVFRLSYVLYILYRHSYSANK